MTACSRARELGDDPPGSWANLASAGYTDVRLQLVDVQLDDGEHPALLCSAMITEGVPYHLLQICFQRGDWMGGLSLSSLESEEALRQLLTRITPNN